MLYTMGERKVELFFSVCMQTLKIASIKSFINMVNRKKAKNDPIDLTVKVSEIYFVIKDSYSALSEALNRGQSEGKRYIANKLSEALRRHDEEIPARMRRKLDTAYSFDRSKIEEILNHPELRSFSF